MSEPIEIKVTRYKCPHCKRGHSKRRAAVEHIARCWRNPAVRACLSCVHFDRDEDGPYCDALNAAVELEAVVVDCPTWSAKNRA